MLSHTAKTHSLHMNGVCGGCGMVNVINVNHFHSQLPASIEVVT